MATPYSMIDDMFLSDIKDDELRCYMMLMIETKY